MAMTATAIVPAAGKAERFGGAKLLAEIDGQTVLDRTLKCLFDAFIEHVVLVVGPGDDYSSARWATADNPRAVLPKRYATRNSSARLTEKEFSFAPAMLLPKPKSSFASFQAKLSRGRQRTTHHTKPKSTKASTSCLITRLQIPKPA